MGPARRSRTGAVTDFVKHLPGASVPEGAVRFWDVDDARRWLHVRVPAAFAPVLERDREREESRGSDTAAVGCGGCGGCG